MQEREREREREDLTITGSEQVKERAVVAAPHPVAPPHTSQYIPVTGEWRERRGVAGGEREG
jgi:hypothetical protein